MICPATASKVLAWAAAGLVYLSLQTEGWLGETHLCGWRGYEREEKEGEREVDNLSTCGCVIQLYLWENTRFIEIREFGWGFLMLTS